MKWISTALLMGVMAGCSHQGHGEAEVQSLPWKEPTDMRATAVGEIKWVDAPASLPAGAKMAMMEGDATKFGMFVMRLKFPDGYKVMPHWHPRTERVTVIAGTLHLGMGEKFDEKGTRRITTGTYGYWAAGMRHYAWFEGETVLQLHGVGPWQIHYVNPADDPRKQTK